MRNIHKVTNALEKGITKAIFDHIRNLSICALLFAGGTYAMKDPSAMYLGSILGKYTGLGAIVFAGLLTLLNMIDGIYQFSKFRRRLWLYFLLIVIYILISLRIIELTWGIRSAIQ